MKKNMIRMTVGDEFLDDAEEVSLLEVVSWCEFNRYSVIGDSDEPRIICGEDKDETTFFLKGEYRKAFTAVTEVLRYEIEQCLQGYSKEVSYQIREVLEHYKVSVRYELRHETNTEKLYIDEYSTYLTENEDNLTIGGAPSGNFQIVYGFSGTVDKVTDTIFEDLPYALWIADEDVDYDDFDGKPEDHMHFASSNGKSGFMDPSTVFYGFTEETYNAFTIICNGE